jgi:hypothetical protein
MTATSPAGPSPLERWAARMDAAIGAVVALGRLDSTAGLRDRVVVGPPATDDELLAVEVAIGLTIPPGLRRLFAMARSFEAGWHLDADPPEPFDQIFAGDASWDLDGVAGLIEAYRGWVAKVFPDPLDPYDLVWHDKFPFLHVMNGDIVAIDAQGRVVYLSHDDGEGHGALLGRDVEDFLDRWTLLGCPGPEDWQWLPFTHGAESVLEPDGEAGRAWRRWFGIP